MKPKAEIWVAAAVSGGLANGWPADHEARTCNDASFVCFNDTLIHTGTLTEIIGVNY
jgi:hypothetical protein